MNDLTHYSEQQHIHGIIAGAKNGSIAAMQAYIEHAGAYFGANHILGLAMVMLLIVLGTFILEDLTCVVAGILASNGILLCSLQSIRGCQMGVA